MTHAVVSTTSGPVPLLPRETGPSKPRQRTLPEPTAPSFRPQEGTAIEDALTPPAPDDHPTTDVMKLRVPLPIVVALVGSIISGVLSAAVAGWAFSSGIRDAQQQIQSDIRIINERMAFTEKTKELEKKNLDLTLDNMRKDIEQSELRKALLDRLRPTP